MTVVRLSETEYESETSKSIILGQATTCHEEVLPCAMWRRRFVLTASVWCWTASSDHCLQF